MNFNERIGRAPRSGVFELSEEGFLVWCGTMIRGDDGLYYLYFSFWPKNKGHSAWVTHSKIGYAVSDDPLGKFTFQGIALSGAGGAEWDRDAVHNPQVLKYRGKYYLYYMGNYGNGEFWDHRNHQRIGAAWADSPRGPWRRLDSPVIGVTEGSFDSLMTSNPCVAEKDGKFYMIYKAVRDNGERPVGGAVVCGTAVADSPLGPFVKQKGPVMVNPENSWSVEDACIWQENGKFYSLAKDFQGYFTGAGKGTVALFESDDSIDWKLSEHPLAFRREIVWEDGEREEFDFMERPQLFLDGNGKPKILICVCVPKGDTGCLHPFSLRIPLRDS